MADQRPSYAPSTLRQLHSRISVRRYFLMHFPGALFPLTAGVMLYGWRGALTIAIVMGSAAAAFLIWRCVGARGRQLHLTHCLWLALLLGLMMPAQLATGTAPPGLTGPSWALLVAAGAGLVIITWLLGGLGAGYVHPVVVVYLLLFLGFRGYLTPTYVLSRSHLVAGDLLNAPDEVTGVSSDPWLKRQPIGKAHALRADAPVQWLTDYTTGRLIPDRGQMPLHELVRDRLPPLEDMTVGGHPSPIGAGSAIAIIIGGLFLLYRGLVDYRIPLLTPVFAGLAMLVLPVPTVIRADGAHWRWLALREPDVRWETAVTFVNYELLAGPLLFVAFFLATSPAIRPLSGRARAIYAAGLGILCAAGQLYISAATGAYVALLLASLAGPVFDRCFKPRPIV